MQSNTTERTTKDKMFEGFQGFSPSKLFSQSFYPSIPLYMKAVLKKSNTKYGSILNHFLTLLVLSDVTL